MRYDLFATATLIPTYDAWGPNVRVTLPLWPLIVVLCILLIRRRPSGNGWCRRCGYDLTGNISGRCPECGAEFDFQDRRSYLARRPLSRPAKSVVAVSIAITLALAAYALTMSALASYARIVDRDVGLHCATIRERTAYEVWGLKLYSTSRIINNSALSTFLCGPETPSDNSWTYGGKSIYTSASEVKRQDQHGVVYLFADTQITVEDLRLVERAWPQLSEVLRRDLLRAPTPEASRDRAYVLELMCDDPTPANVEELVKTWEDFAQGGD